MTPDALQSRNNSFDSAMTLHLPKRPSQHLQRRSSPKCDRDYKELPPSTVLHRVLSFQDHLCSQPAFEKYLSSLLRLVFGRYSVAKYIRAFAAARTQLFRMPFFQG